ncbi:MAG TPA: 4Fe-4S dicluster domain-containing protein [Candidatus Bipolaricaulota bacterium]|nr:4Fe-4S dicluster domain-containing protein [Candidatus Bipolaricaulota bacterium]
MTKSALNQLLLCLLKKNVFFAPRKIDDDIAVVEISDIKEMDWSWKLPKQSFKHLLLPSTEEILKQDEKGLCEIFEKKSRVIFGINILDLQALTYLEAIFSEDVYYQKRRAKTLLIGYSAGLPQDYRKYKIFHEKFREDKLEHLNFDIFIEEQKNKNLKIFSGSEKGQQILEENGISDYMNIEYAGPIPEEGPNKEFVLKNRELIFKSKPEDKLWQELGKICLACGKCSLVCPLCFCFEHEDVADGDVISRKRKWSSCFYPEFTKITNGENDMRHAAEKLYYWYYHKFVRMTDEYKFPGCVGCMRCFQACPVGISIAENFKNLRK